MNCASSYDGPYLCCLDEEDAWYMLGELQDRMFGIMLKVRCLPIEPLIKATIDLHVKEHHSILL